MSALEETVIRPPGAHTRISFRELAAFREMFFALVRRNIRLHFFAMRIGFVWTFARPLLYVTVFTLFKRLSNADIFVTIPYPLYLYSGLILWYYLLESTQTSATAVRRDAELIKRIYFPRLLSPAVPLVANVANLGLAALPMLGIMAWYGVAPGWNLLLLPLVLLQVMALVLGFGTMVAALSVDARDWEKLLGNILQIGLWISPVIYAVEMIPEAARPVYLLNPAAGSLLAFRATLFEGFPFPWAQWLYSLFATGLILFCGVRMFQRVEAHLADRL